MRRSSSSTRCSGTTCTAWDRCWRGWQLFYKPLPGWTSTPGTWAMLLCRLQLQLPPQVSLCMVVQSLSELRLF